MPKLPAISAQQTIKVFEKIGYQIVRKRGSHFRLRHLTKKSLTIPDHQTIGKGLLRKLIRDAEITREKFEESLKS